MDLYYLHNYLIQLLEVLPFLSYSQTYYYSGVYFFLLEVLSMLIDD